MFLVASILYPEGIYPKTNNVTALGNAVLKRISSWRLPVVFTASYASVSYIEAKTISISIIADIIAYIFSIYVIISE